GGAGRAVQPGAAAAGRRGHGVAGHDQPGRTKLAGNAAQKANRTLPQIDRLLAEAAAADAADDARLGGKPDEPTPRALARQAGRRERLAAARDRLAAEDQARRDAQRARQDAWDAAAAAGVRRGGRRPGDEPPRPNRNNTEPRAASPTRTCG